MVLELNGLKEVNGVVVDDVKAELEENGLEVMVNGLTLVNGDGVAGVFEVLNGFSANIVPGDVTATGGGVFSSVSWCCITELGVSIVILVQSIS